MPALGTAESTHQTVLFICQLQHIHGVGQSPKHILRKQVRMNINLGREGCTLWWGVSIDLCFATPDNTYCSAPAWKTSISAFVQLQLQERSEKIWLQYYVLRNGIPPSSHLLTLKTHTFFGMKEYLLYCQFTLIVLIYLHCPILNYGQENKHNHFNTWPLDKLLLFRSITE